MLRDSINEREIIQFEEGKVKLPLYKTFNKVVEFSRASDAGSRFKFRSGTHGLKGRGSCCVMSVKV